MLESRCTSTDLPGATNAPVDLKAAVLGPTTFATLLAVTTATALALLAATLLPTIVTATTTAATLAVLLLLLSPTPTSATAAATTLTVTALLLPATSEALLLPPRTVPLETEADLTRTATITTTTPPLDQTTLPTRSLVH